jgi:hypothetical protein
VFETDERELLADYVDWENPPDAFIAPAELLAAMKVRAFPDRDKSHKRLKDLADLHALLWYVTDYADIRSAVRERLTDEDITAFESAMSDDLSARTARLIDVDPTIIRQSIDRLLS